MSHAEADGKAGRRVGMSLGCRSRRLRGQKGRGQGGCAVDWFRAIAYDQVQGAKAALRFCSRKEDLMYAAIRQATAKPGTAEELARRIKEGAIPSISEVEGFMAYY